ncbi:putative bifunctional diguanylate cyclase/phosphodiesterase [Nitratidesulfovibrio sp. SRB-5]|uniref:putative bifunctional diguanylate cyclase/phosphodiesterase n=1 Tax=Nitratidesulfovibrio sp. SRB-5 TaxID=2872636 RepID=UPI001CBDF1E9|nr:EAL domain-containing protein [Nitratidesulfovibrio sp. SRB-5]
MIIAAILGMIIPYQQGVLRRGMESQADKLASSVAEVAASALAAQDYAALVDHCTGVLQRQPGLEYIVVTRMDGSSLVFRRGGWGFQAAPRDSAGVAAKTEPSSGFRLGLPPGLDVPAPRGSARLPGGLNGQPGVPDAPGTANSPASPNPAGAVSPGTFPGVFTDRAADGPEVYHHTLPVERAGISICTVAVGLALDGYRAEQRAAWWHIGALTAMAMLVALATALLLSRTVTRTVLRLSGWVRSIGPGNMGQRIRIDTGDELEGLANAFNGMLDLLEASQRELNEAHRELERRVRDRTAQLCDANAKLHLMGEVFTHAVEGIFITDSAGTVVAVNPAFERITGVDAQSMVGRLSPALGMVPVNGTRSVWDEMLEHGSWIGETRGPHRDGWQIPQWLSLVSIRDEAGVILNCVGVFSDITDIKQKEAQITHQANHDDLTGLPNRKHIFELLHDAIARASVRGQKLAVVFIDMDGFKFINDSYDHATGDQLLCDVARRLRAALRPGDILGRLGGDEFVAAVGGISDKGHLDGIMRRLFETFAEPFEYGGMGFSVTASFGVSVYPEDGDSANALLSRADIAMYRAKDMGKNAIAVFCEEQCLEFTRRYRMDQEIKAAIAGREFRLVYQPIADARTLRVRKVEALLRWERDGAVVAPPSVFIPVAESSNAIREITRLVVEMACAQHAAWRLEGLTLPVAVNISSRCLNSDETISHIAACLNAYDVPPDALEVEITETSLMQNYDRGNAMLCTLRDLGVRVSLDDFGTGYSSLQYLARMPIHALKIDRTFVQELLDEGGSLEIVETILGLARSLRLATVAEGVETAAQLSALRGMGVDYLQGYCLGRPLPADDILTLCRRGMRLVPRDVER